jgi:hypothetical protein
LRSKIKKTLHFPDLTVLRLYEKFLVGESNILLFQKNQVKFEKDANEPFSNSFGPASTEKAPARRPARPRIIKCIYQPGGIGGLRDNKIGISEGLLLSGVKNAKEGAGAVTLSTHPHQMEENLK